MEDIVDVLRQRPFRRASESQDEMRVRRQAERDRGAEEIERLRVRVSWFESAVHTCHDECNRPLCKTTRQRDRLRAVLDELLAEAEDVFVCMADATGIDRHNYPPPYLKARAELEGEHD